MDIENLASTQNQTISEQPKIPIIKLRRQIKDGVKRDRFKIIKEQLNTKPEFSTILVDKKEILPSHPEIKNKTYRERFAEKEKRRREELEKKTLELECIFVSGEKIYPSHPDYNDHVKTIEKLREERLKIANLDKAELERLDNEICRRSTLRKLRLVMQRLAKNKRQQFIISINKELDKILAGKLRLQLFKVPANQPIVLAGRQLFRSNRYFKYILNKMINAHVAITKKKILRNKTTFKSFIAQNFNSLRLNKLQNIFHPIASGTQITAQNQFPMAPPSTQTQNTVINQQDPIPAELITCENSFLKIPTTLSKILSSPIVTGPLLLPSPPLLSIHWKTDTNDNKKKCYSQNGTQNENLHYLFTLLNSSNVYYDKYAKGVYFLVGAVTRQEGREDMIAYFYKLYQRLINCNYDVDDHMIFLATHIADMYVIKFRAMNNMTFDTFMDTVWYMASKFIYEINPQYKNRKLYVTPNILKSEKEILQALDLDLNLRVPHSLNLLETFSMCYNVEHKYFMMAQYILELAIINYRSLGYNNGNLAKAALLVSYIKIDRWGIDEIYEIPNTIKDMKFNKTVDLLLNCIRRPKNLLINETFSKKYSSNKYVEISQFLS